MRKTDFILMVSVLSVSLLTGCSKNSTNNKSSSTTENNNISVVIDTESTYTKDEEAGKSLSGAENELSIRDEMAEVESKSLEYENADWDIPQQEMNAKADEWYVLWDNELNSLWSRLKNELSEDELAPVLEEQRSWIDRKAKNVIGAGFSAYGGTLRPLLESSKAEEMTRVRAYVLAEYLARAKGEDYTMPESVSNIITEVDPSLDSIFEVFSGTHEQSEELSVNVCRLEDSDFTPDQFAESVKWVMWYTHSSVLTNDDVYAYTVDTIIFENGGIYYALEKGVEGDSIILMVGEDMAFMDVVGVFN